MGQKELIEALWRKGEEKIGRLKEEAEQKAAAVSKELTERLQQKRASCEQQEETAREAQIRKIELQADQEKRRCRSQSKEELAGRLVQTAERLLPVLRQKEYEALFRRLAGEISPLNPEQVAVNPLDRGLAKDFFPAAVIVGDPAIAGGLKASSSRDGIVIDNTLEKRLQRAWPELLPRLITEIEEEMG